MSGATRRRQRGLALALAGLALAARAALAAEALAPPTPAEIKACVQQMDLSHQWAFDWKAIEVGQARHPRNAYERIGLAQPDADVGYPVHVVYVFNHATTIDAQYWATHDAAGHWWIAALCRP
jgi:hypothetical protein